MNFLSRWCGGYFLVLFLFFLPADIFSFFVQTLRDFFLQTSVEFGRWSFIPVMPKIELICVFFENWYVYIADILCVCLRGILVYLSFVRVQETRGQILESLNKIESRMKFKCVYSWVITHRHTKMYTNTIFHSMYMEL